MKLSAIVITKNEENMIADCLDSLSFCDEILVIDSGSTDHTVELSKRLGARVISTSAKNFAEYRNIGHKEAKGEWVLYIDADERVTKPLKEAIEEIVSSRMKGYVGYRLKRKNYYFVKHEWPYIEKLERLFKKDCLKKWYGVIHESPKIEGGVGDLDGFLVHYTHRDLTSMLEKTIEWSEIEAKTRYLAEHPQMKWWRFPRVMIPVFFSSYFLQKGYKAGLAGIVESMYQMFSIFVTYARLWEMQQQKSEHA